MRTFFAWTIGTVNTVLWGSLSLIGSLFDRSGMWAHRCMVAWSRINLRLMGIRVEASGLERVQRDTPQVFVANHQSMADILILAATLPVPFRFVAKRELFDVPFLGWHMRRAGFIPIERNHPRRAARALVAAATRIKGGVNALVFPEGTRSEEGSLLPFHGGGFLLAIRADAVVVPIALEGTSQIIRKAEWTIRPARARVTVLEPIDSSAYADDRDGLRDRVRALIGAELAGAAIAANSGR